MPVSKGAMGDQFEVHSSNGIPYLFTNDLPYSTYFEESRRVRQSLVGEWMFRTDPENKGIQESWFRSEAADLDLSGWEQTVIPSVLDAESEERIFYEGISWYRKVFKRDAVPEGYWSRLCFEEVFLRSEVYLNGHKLCESEGGNFPFFLDVSDFLKADEDNILVLRVESRSDWESIPPTDRKDHNPGRYMYGGIYGDVSIETIPENYVFKAVARTVKLGDNTALGLDVLVYAPHSTCRIDVALLDPQGIRCGGTLLNAELDDLNQHDSSLGAAVRGVSCELLLDNPRFWNPGDTNLYTVLVETASAGFSDKVVFRTGLKSMDNGKILINDESPLLNGISKFEEKESIFHLPAKLLGKHQMKTLPLLQNAQKQLIEMIERDINNPAILFWSVGSEYYTLLKNEEPIFSWLQSVAKAFDSSRPVSMSEDTV